MTVDPDQLWFVIVVAVVTGGGALLMQRLQSIERVLQRHGLKLVRIETKLGILDTNGDDAP